MKNIWRKSAASSIVLLFIMLVASMPTMANAAEKEYQRSIESFPIPDVTLVNQNARKVRFKDLLQSDKPVIIDFIFCTCTTICPVLSANFVSLQNALGNSSPNVHLVSISIDPEHDKPKIMKEYLQRYRAKPGWDFLTGSRKDIDSVMRAFNAFIPNKMSHQPLIFLRMPKDGKWIRLYGYLSTSEFMEEVKLAGLR